MTSIMLLCTEGEAGARSLRPPALHEIFKIVKRQLKTQAKNFVPLQYIEKLPASPDEIRRKYTQLHQAVFASAGPVSCPFGTETVALAADAIPMRGSKSVCRWLPSSDDPDSAGCAKSWQHDGGHARAVDASAGVAGAVGRGNGEKVIRLIVPHLLSASAPVELCTPCRRPRRQQRSERG